MYFSVTLRFLHLLSFLNNKLICSFCKCIIIRHFCMKFVSTDWRRHIKLCGPLFSSLLLIELLSFGFHLIYAHMILCTSSVSFPPYLLVSSWSLSPGWGLSFYILLLLVCLWRELCGNSEKSRTNGNCFISPG